MVRPISIVGVLHFFSFSFVDCSYWNGWSYGKLGSRGCWLLQKGPFSCWEIVGKGREVGNICGNGCCMIFSNFILRLRLLVYYCGTVQVLKKGKERKGKLKTEDPASKSNFGILPSFGWFFLGPKWRLSETWVVIWIPCMQL